MPTLKQIRSISLIIVVTFCLIYSEALAQRGTGRIYNPDTVETLKGTVESIETLSSKGMGPGVHIGLKTDQGHIVPVHLGPKWFMDKQALQLKQGDSIEVTGSRVTISNMPAIIASEIKRGDEVLKLRDANGYPYWSRRGRK